MFTEMKVSGSTRNSTKKCFLFESANTIYLSIIIIWNINNNKKNYANSDSKHKKSMKLTPVTSY